MAADYLFPDSREFVFTVFDDTDNATVANCAPVYDLLYRCGLRTTKSVWVYPPRGRYKGGSLQDREYRHWVLGLRDRGFEIALHNVGDGRFTRDEILRGLDEFRRIVGHYPVVHTNHVSNPDNLYWWDQRFEWPVSAAYALFRRLKGLNEVSRAGHDPDSPCFWGDAFMKTGRYVRNFTFNSIDSLGADPMMPYHVASKPFVPFWFSSSDGHTVREFTDLIAPKAIDFLAERRSVCIVYTHFAFGFVRPNGVVDPNFQERLEGIASRNGWFVPVGTVLDHLREHRTGDSCPSYAYRAMLNLAWARDRLLKRLRYSR